MHVESTSQDKMFYVAEQSFLLGKEFAESAAIKASTEMQTFEVGHKKTR